MRLNFLLPSRLAFFSVISALMICMLATTANAQSNASEAPPAPISTEDLPQEPKWKSPVDYSAVVASERVIASQKLASPATKQLEFALYTAYDRMLAYMQTDMVGGVPIDKVAEINFVKVTHEAITDPALTNLEMPAFNGLYVALLNMLHQ